MFPFARLLLLGSLVSLIPTATNAQTSIATVPEGVVKVAIPAGPSTTMIGVPLKGVPTAHRPVTAYTSTTITLSNVSFTSGALATSAAPYYALFTTGAQAGRYLSVTANTSDTLTLDTADGTSTAVALDASGFSVGVGDQVEIIPADTLGSLFGTGADLVITGGTNAFTADTVGIWNGVRFITYYYSTSLGHWIESGKTTSEDSHVLRPDEAVSLTRRSGRAAFNLILPGVVATHRLLSKHPGAQGRVMVRMSPIDGVLSDLKSTELGTLQAGTSVFNSDTVGIWNGVRWETYYPISSGGWRKSGDSSTDYSNLAITPGLGVYVLRRTSQTGTNTFLATSPAL